MDITYAFTDEHFRQVVLDRFCDQRDFIQESDVCEVEILELSNHNISNLDGIEYFRGLQELDCAYNQLTGLDLSSESQAEDITLQRESASYTGPPFQFGIAGAGLQF